MDDAWWMPAFKRPEGVMSVLVSERSIPRSVIVDQTGHRFVNEAAPYVTFVHRQLAGGHDPIWFVFDRKAKNRYQFGVMPVRIPGDWFTSGLMTARIPGGAGFGDRGAAVVAAPTADRFNGLARDGQGLDLAEEQRLRPLLRRPDVAATDYGCHRQPALLCGTYSGRRLGTKGGLVLTPTARCAGLRHGHPRPLCHR